MTDTIGTASVIKEKDVATTVIYLQIVNGNPVESISVQSVGAMPRPAKGEQVEVHERATGSIVAGTVDRIAHKVSVTGGGAVDTFLAHGIEVHVV